jgi:hypothetical protein
LGVFLIALVSHVGKNRVMFPSIALK